MIEKDSGREVKKDGSFSVPLSFGENRLPVGTLILSRSALSGGVRLAPIGDLTARSRQEGDKILSGGMHKSVKKLMCDKKIPISKRNSIPIVCDGEGILWIPGVAVRDKDKNSKENITLLYNEV